MKWPFLSKLVPAPVDRRRVVRLRARRDSFIRVEGRDAPIWTWSKYGVSCAPYSGALRPGQRARIRLILKEIPKAAPLDLEVDITVRRMGYGELACEFYRLSPRIKLQMNAYYQKVVDLR